MLMAHGPWSMGKTESWIQFSIVPTELGIIGLLIPPLRPAGTVVGYILCSLREQGPMIVYIPGAR